MKNFPRCARLRVSVRRLETRDYKSQNFEIWSESCRLQTTCLVVSRLLAAGLVARLANFANLILIIFQNLKFCKILAGSFSAVSKRIFARKYAFDSIFQALQDLHTSAPLQSQNFSKNRFEKSVIFVKIQQKFCKCRKICKILPNFKKFS